jgi:hypothetical protein
VAAFALNLTEAVAVANAACSSAGSEKEKEHHRHFFLSPSPSVPDKYRRPARRAGSVSHHGQLGPRGPDPGMVGNAPDRECQISQRVRHERQRSAQYASLCARRT